MTLRHRRLLSLALAATIPALTACGGDSGAAPGETEPTVERHGSWRRVRLAIPLQGSDDVRVYDVGREAFVATLAVPGASSLRVSSNGRYAFGVVDGALHVLRGGVTFFAHLDHYDLVKSAPRLLDVDLPASPLRDGASNAGWLVLGSPSGAGHWALREDSLINPEPERVVLGEEPADATQGVALGSGFVVVTEGGELVPVSRAGQRGAEIGRCTQLKTLAAYGERAALACAEGVIEVTVSGESTPVARVLTAAAGVTTILLHPARRELVLRFEDGGYAVLGDDGQTRALVLDNSPCEVALEPSTGDTLAVLDADGGVRRVALSGEATGDPLQVVPAFDCAAATRPRLALAPERAYVSDPLAGLVHDVDTRQMREAAVLEVDGTPAAVHVLGIDVGDANASTVAVH